MIDIKKAKKIIHSDEGISYIPVTNKKTFSISYVFLKKNESVPLHKHQKTKGVYFITKGKARLIVGKKSFNAGKGTFIDLPNKIPHKISNKGKTVLEFIVFECPPDDNDYEQLE